MHMAEQTNMHMPVLSSSTVNLDLEQIQEEWVMERKRKKREKKIWNTLLLD